MAWSLVSWQVISIVSLIVGVYLFGFAPLLLGNTVSKAHISLLSAFSGGVLIGTTFIHLFPEVAALAAEFRCAVRIYLSSAIGELLICVGLVAVMIVENMATKYEHVAHQVSVQSQLDEDEEDESATLFDPHHHKHQGGHSHKLEGGQKQYYVSNNAKNSNKSVQNTSSCTKKHVLPSSSNHLQNIPSGIPSKASNIPRITFPNHTKRAVYSSYPSQGSFHWQGRGLKIRDHEFRSRHYEENSTIHVGNLPNRTISLEINKLFSGFGKIELITLKRSYKNNEYALVKFATVRSALAAVKYYETRNLTIKGSYLRVTMSNQSRKVPYSMKKCTEDFLC